MNPPFVPLKINAPVISALNFALPFSLQVDACFYGAGAVLMQADNVGIEHPVIYLLKKLPDVREL